MVLESAPITDYGILINKLEPEEIEAILSDPDAQKAILAGFMNEMPVKTLLFHWAPRHQYLAGKKDQGLKLDDGMRNFLENVPSIVIKSDQVKDIAVDKFEAMQANFESLIAKMNEDKEFLMKKISEDATNYQAMMQRMQDQNVRLSERLDEAMRNQQSGK